MIDKSIKKTGLKPITLFFIVIIGLPLIFMLLAFLVLTSPFLLIGYIVYAVLDYKKETLIPRQKHKRVLKGLGF